MKKQCPEALQFQQGDRNGLAVHSCDCDFPLVVKEFHGNCYFCDEQGTIRCRVRTNKELYLALITRNSPFPSMSSQEIQYAIELLRNEDEKSLQRRNPLRPRLSVFNPLLRVYRIWKRGRAELQHNVKGILPRTIE